MERFAIHPVTRNNHFPVFDPETKVPENPFLRGHLNIARLAGVDDAFANLIEQANPGHSKIIDVYEWITTSGIDNVAHALIPFTSSAPTDIKKKLLHIDTVLSESAYYPLLPRVHGKKFYLTPQGDISDNIENTTIFRSTNERLDNLYELAKHLSYTESNPLDGVLPRARTRLTKHVKELIEKVNNNKTSILDLHESRVLDPPLTIPNSKHDPNATGIIDTIHITTSGVLKSATVSLDIVHENIANLRVELIAPNGQTVLLHENTANKQGDLKHTYTVDNSALRDLKGISVNNQWKLRIRNICNQGAGYLKKWDLDLSVHHSNTNLLSTAQIKRFYAGCGAILRRLARVGSDIEKEEAFNALADLIIQCPFPDIRILLISSLHQSLESLDLKAQQVFKQKLAPLIAPHTPNYDYIFRKTYENGKSVAHKDSLNVALYFGDEDDNLMYTGGVQMLEADGFVKQESSDKPGFELYVKKVNTDDPEQACKKINVYVDKMDGINALKLMNHPDIDVIQYDGHSNLARNIENCLEHASELSGSKVVILGACATTDRLFALRNKYPDPQKVQFINTYESTYFNWKIENGKKVMNYSENMKLFFAITDSMSKQKNWDDMNQDFSHATHSWSHSVDINYTNPGKLEWLMLVDLDQDGLCDARDSVWDGERIVPQEIFHEEFSAKAPTIPRELLNGIKAMKAIQSLNTFGRYNQLCKKAYKVRSIATFGYDKNAGINDPMVIVSKNKTGGWQANINPCFAHASEEAIRMVAHYEFIMALMKAGEGRFDMQDPVDQKIFALYFAAVSLRYDNSYYDDRVWKGFLKAFNFPENISLLDFFEVIDNEHDRTQIWLAGGYRNITDIRERLSPSILVALEQENVGTWRSMEA